MTEGQPTFERQNGKATVPEVKEFLEGRGRLLDPEFQDLFRSQITLYEVWETDLGKMNIWKQKLPFLEMRKKSSLKSYEKKIKYAFEVLGKFANMFNDTESLPRVATEMAKWGAEELLAPVLVRKKGSTMGDREKAFEERRTKWFSGLEKMMKAAEAWRMLLSVNGSVTNEELTTGKLVGGEQDKIEFVSKVYEFMDKSKGKDFDDFTALLDSYFVPEGIRVDEREKRLEQAKDSIRKTDGYTFLDIVASKAAQEIDGTIKQPMFYEYMWMVVTGKTDRYTKAFAERLKVVGGRESKENPDTFMPQLWAGVANEIDVKQGVAKAAGNLIKVNFQDLKDKSGNIKPWFERKLREISADSMLDDESEGAIWVAMEIDLSKVLGNNSGFADYARKIRAVDKSLVTMAIPVSISEADALVEKYSDSTKINEIREALIDAYTKRLAALSMWHGFGADQEVYLTPAWAQAALNAALPDMDPENGNYITNKNIEERSLSDLLSNRLCGVILNVLGAKGTGIETRKSEKYYNTAGSMERATWYVLEVHRALTLLPGSEENQATIGYGSSIGGQIAHRLRILLPESVRGKVHIICATPVSTKNWRINTFMHGSPKNSLGDAVIQLRHNSNKALALAGRGMASIGRVMGIDKSIINDMIIPPDASKFGTDRRECRAMIGVHKRIYDQEAEYIALQRGNLETKKFAFAQYTIDNLLLTSAVTGGSEMTVLVGSLDEVLDPTIQKKNYKKYPTLYSIYDFSDGNWRKKLDDWVKNREIYKFLDHQTPVIVGNFAHYLNVNKTGRIFIAKVLESLVKPKVKAVPEPIAVTLDQSIPVA